MAWVLSKSSVKDAKFYYFGKKLAQLLRHLEGFSNLKGFLLNKIGYADVLHVLKLFGEKLSLTMLEEIVQNDPKGRFHLKFEDGKHQIRANQGHSKNVTDKFLDLDLMYEILKEAVFCIHGTNQKAWDLIKYLALKRMKRGCIHMAGTNARSGMRKIVDVIIVIDMEGAMKAGIKFYRSTNGVILTPTDIPCEFLKGYTRDEFYEAYPDQKPQSVAKEPTAATECTADEEEEQPASAAQSASAAHSTD